MAFVGTSSVESAEQLRQFLADIIQEQSYYFLRSPHQVSGIQSELPKDIDSVTEGQVFNSQWELRWKKKGSGYDLLLLSQENTEICHKFVKISLDWKIEDRNALLYEANEIKDRQIRSKETRFPQGFTHKQPRIGQRYFLNSQTATVHFVALTVRAK